MRPLDSLRHVYRALTDGSAATDLGRRLDCDTSFRARIADLALQHRVALTLVEALAGRCRFADSPPAAVTEHARLYRVRRAALLDSLCRLASTERSLANDAMVLKGMALRRWWPRDRVRTFQDLDVVTGSEASLWTLCERYRQQGGFEITALGGAHRRRLGEDWAFTFQLTAWTDSVPYSVEFQQSYFLPSEHSAFDLRPLMRMAAAQSGVDTGEIRLPVLQPTRLGCLQVLLAEVSSRSLLLRDLLDFEYLVLGHEELAPLQGEELAAAGLDAVLAAMLARLAAAHRRIGGSPLPRDVARAVRDRSRAPLERLCRLAPAVLQAREAIDERAVWRRDRRSASVPAGRLDSTRGTIRLLHISDGGRGPREWAAGADGELLLRTPIGVFLATPSVAFDEEFLERAAAGMPAAWLRSS